MTEQELNQKVIELRKGSKDQTDFEASVAELLKTEPIVDEAGNKIEVNAKFVYKDEKDNPMADEKKETPVVDTKQLVREAVEEGLKGLKISGGETRDDDGRQGFKNVGEFAHCVYKAARFAREGVGELDKRLQTKAPTTYSAGYDGTAGGYAIPPTFRTDIWTAVDDYQFLAPLVDVNTTIGDSLTLAADETTPWGSAGIIAGWTAEGVQMTQRAAALQQRHVQLQTLTGLVLATDQVLNDAPRLQDLIARKLPLALRWKVDEAIFRGSGVGEPLGILNSGALLSVAKESTQSAASVVALNIAKMYGAMRPEGLGSAVWFCSNSVIPQLLSLTVGQYPVFLPVAGGAPSMIGAPAGLLLGKPVYITNHCSAMGTAGDMIFANMKGYCGVVKSGIDSIKFDSSIHLFFDYNITAFRGVMRFGGEPYLSTYITAPNSNLATSDFVTVAVRP